MTMNNANITLDFNIIDLLESKKLSLDELGLYVMLWAISDKSLIFYNITDLAKLGNCGVDRIRTLINKLIEKELLIEIKINQRKYIFKVLRPSENYENAKKGFLKQ